jgi:hypothetical protein
MRQRFARNDDDSKKRSNKTRIVQREERTAVAVIK